MRQQITLTIALSIVLCAAVAIRVAYFPRPSGQSAFFFLSLFWICGVLIVIFLINFIWHWIAGPGRIEKQHKFVSWPNRRRTFRIIYPTFIRPTLILDTADHRPKRNLEFQVIDLSQEGLCFLDDGMLDTMEHFAGRLLIDNGNQVKISGRFIRKNGNHISVQFNKSLDWSTLTAEQQRVMSHMKPAR